MSDYNAVNNPLRRSTFRHLPPPPPPTSMASEGPAPSIDSNKGKWRNETWIALKNIHGHLCHDLSMTTLAPVLDLFPTDEVATHFVRAYKNLDQAGLAPQALALCIFCVFEALHFRHDIPMLLQILADSLQRLEGQSDNLPRHTGSIDALYNHIFGLLAVRTVSDKAIITEDLQRIFRAYNSEDKILLCFNDWLARSEVVQVRGTKPTEAERVPFFKNIWMTVRRFLDECYQCQTPQQHLLVQVMRNLASWHATLCILEGIRDSGADVFVTTWGAPLQALQTLSSFGNQVILTRAVVLLQVVWEPHSLTFVLIHRSSQTCSKQLRAPRTFPPPDKTHLAAYAALPVIPHAIVAGLAETVEKPDLARTSAYLAPTSGSRLRLEDSGKQRCTTESSRARRWRPLVRSGSLPRLAICRPQ